MYDNLLTLLNIDEFPQAPRVDESMKDEGMVGEGECCICFSMELDGGELPDEVCGNHRCNRCFHSSCLYQVCVFQ